MSKYINLEKQLVRLYQLGIKDEEVIKQFLLTACTEDVQKVQHGWWINGRCSVCQEEAPYTYDGFWEETPYCPNCGAKMEVKV